MNLSSEWNLYIMAYSLVFWIPQFFCIRLARKSRRKGSSLAKSYLTLYAPFLLFCLLGFSFALGMLLVFGVFMLLIWGPTLVYTCVLPFSSTQPEPSSEWQKKWLDK